MVYLISVLWPDFLYSVLCMLCSVGVLFWLQVRTASEVRRSSNAGGVWWMFV